MGRERNRSRNRSRFPELASIKSACLKVEGSTETSRRLRSAAFLAFWPRNVTKGYVLAVPSLPASGAVQFIYRTASSFSVARERIPFVEDEWQHRALLQY